MSSLLDHLISVQNKSGAIPAAPMSLKSLKSGILGVPFDVTTPGMSGLLSLSNLVPGLVQVIQKLGSIQSVGNFGPILSRALGELSGTGLSATDPVRLGTALQRALSAEELQQVVGPIQSLGASLITASGGGEFTPSFDFPTGGAEAGSGVQAGDISISGNVIWHNVVNPWVLKSGDTMTGPLNLSANLNMSANVYMSNSGMFVDRGDTGGPFIELSNLTGAGALRVGSAGYTNIWFDNRYGFAITSGSVTDIQSGTFAAGTSLFVISNTGVITTTNTILGTASTTAGPTIRLPHGTAPSPATNGDMWTESAAGLKVQINGSTYTMATLEGSNQTFTGNTPIFMNSTSSQPQIYFWNTANDATNPYVIFRKTRSGGPVQVNDSLGLLLWQAADANSVIRTAGYISMQALAVNSGEVDTQMNFVTGASGAVSLRGAIRNGWIVGSTPGDAGFGTINTQNGYYYAGTAIPFQKAFESAQQTITSAGALTLAHGLGAKPKLYQAYLVCATAEGGYSIGDEVIVDPGWTADASIGRGLSIVPDATNMNIRFGNNAQAFIIVNKTTGANFNITNTNWKLVIRAWA